MIFHRPLTILGIPMCLGYFLLELDDESPLVKDTSYLRDRTWRI